MAEFPFARTEMCMASVFLCCHLLIKKKKKIMLSFLLVASLHQISLQADIGFESALAVEHRTFDFNATVAQNHLRFFTFVILLLG